MNARAIGRYAICVLLILFCCAAHGEITPDGKRVLLLYSYHPGFPTSQRILAGIRSIFSSGHRLIDIEYMDTKRLYNEESLENFHQQLSYKLVNRDPYDLVITADDNALDYVLGLGKNLFGKTDKVFLGVNDIQKAMSLDARPDVTGVVEAPSFRETIDLVKTIFPQRKRAYILVDGTPSGQSDLRSIQEVVEGEKALRFETISLEDINWQTFTNQLSAIDQDGVIFLISAYRDVDETHMTFEESLQIIRNATDLPIFHFWRHGMGKGILGGVIIDHYAQGREAAVLAAQILDGSSASTPPI
ncbi:MAG: histidine kinase, partial [Candidatus Thiodiazotropha sp. (ex Semelilucina semeliformis)]|nr:histidine kinase [Candidatus Thiodiazotropha sp. (ex Semelilucina semeliformis)]